MTDNIVWLDFNEVPTRPIEEPSQRRERLRAALLNNLEAVLRHLFPQGHVRHGVFRIGDCRGAPGDSLTVTLRGERAGLWQDFATGEGGDVFDLWAAAIGLDAKRSFGAVLDSIEAWLGLTPIIPQRSAPVMDDLGPPTGKWDYLDAQGKLLACVYRYDPPVGGKQFRPWDAVARKRKAPDPRPLYNQPGIAVADHIVLVEGEKCADALIGQGITATTAMQGANAPIAKTDWSPLRGKHVIVWPDNDAPGHTYAQRAAEAMHAAGAASVSLLSIPSDKPSKWDAADAVAEGVNISAILQTAQPIPKGTPNTGSVQLRDWSAQRYSGMAPERRYLIEQCVPMAAVTILAAMGDTGKGMLSLDLSLKVAGVFYGDEPPLCLGNPVVNFGTAVVLTAEDDQGEVHRRLQALDPEQRRLIHPHRLIIVPLPNAGGPMALVQMTADGPIATPFYHSLKAQLLAIPDLCLLVIDPISCFFQADINKDPVAGAFATGLIAALASETGAAVLAAHHMRKPSGSTPISTPEQARDAIRGTTALVDGVRAAYALWPVEEKDARAICRRLELDFQRGRVFQGAIVKSNGPADRTVRTFVRDRHTGLLIDRTQAIKARAEYDKQLPGLLAEGIAHLAATGRPLTHTGVNGVYRRRAELATLLRDVSRNRLESLVSELLGNQRIVKCLAGGSKTVQWLDVPDGPFAQGRGAFVEGASHAAV